MSITLVTRSPASGSAVTLAAPAEAADKLHAGPPKPAARAWLGTTMGGAYLDARECRMLASRLIRAAKR